MPRQVQKATKKRAEQTTKATGDSGSRSDLSADLAAARARIASLEEEVENLRRLAGRNVAPTEPSTDRRTLILEAAGRLFAESGFFNTTIRDVANEAGILSGSLYHHFTSKEEMLQEIIASHHDDLLAETYAAVADVSPIEALRRLIKTVNYLTEKNWVAATILRKDGVYLRQLPRFSYLNDVAAEVQGVWVGVIDEAKRADQVRDDVDSAVIYRFILDAISNWQPPRQGGIDLSTIATFYINLIFEGIATSSESRR
jgi:AcrR family transcriptional regulator